MNSTEDGDDAFPGDGVCETQDGVCTLRAALDEVIARNNGADGISFQIPTTDPGYRNGVWTIRLTKALPDISIPVTISGPGATKLLVDGLGGGKVRIFNITTNGTVSFSGVTITNGLAVVAQGQSGGGGIQNVNGGTVNVTNCTLRSNLATGLGTGFNGSGGAIYNGSGTVNVTKSTLKSNIANSDPGVPSFGGGIFNAAGSIHISNSTLDHNQTDQGGGIYSGQNGTVTITGSTFYENVAETRGGGIATAIFGTLNVTSTTFYANIASRPGSGFGGGIYNGGTLNLTNSTIAANFSNHGGSGVFNGGNATANVKSAIIADNFGGLDTSGPAPDVSGIFQSSGFNLIGKRDGSTGFTAATDKKGTVATPLDPKLDPLGLRSNGGSTQTIALMVGSPAIDAGTSVGLTGTLTKDQRGYSRTYDNASVTNATGGDGTDIGAYERETQ